MRVFSAGELIYNVVHQKGAEFIRYDSMESSLLYIKDCVTPWMSRDCISFRKGDSVRMKDREMFGIGIVDNRAMFRQIGFDEWWVEVLFPGRELNSWQVSVLEHVELSVPSRKMGRKSLYITPPYKSIYE